MPSMRAGTYAMESVVHPARIFRLTETQAESRIELVFMVRAELVWAGEHLHHALITVGFELADSRAVEIAGR
jgi:hypothetical protein